MNAIPDIPETTVEVEHVFDILNTVGPVPNNSDEESEPISNLWKQTHRTSDLANTDFYQDWVDSLESDVDLVGSLLPPGPDEMGCDADEMSDDEYDLGIQLPGEISCFFLSTTVSYQTLSQILMLLTNCLLRKIVPLRPIRRHIHGHL